MDQHCLSKRGKWYDQLISRTSHLFVTPFVSHVIRLQIYEALDRDEEGYKYFAKFMVTKGTDAVDGEQQREDAARSYRAMNVLRQDLRSSGILLPSPTQAGLLAKELLSGLAAPGLPRYKTLHIRELLDALLERYPEKVMAAACAGGIAGVQAHLQPLMRSDQTLTILTHLVCLGCTGRKGIASAEKSAQHTAMYHHTPIISLGPRRKFVKAMADFELMSRLEVSLTSQNQFGEELCETILTILEVVGYPPKDGPMMGAKQEEDGKVKVGEDTLLLPMTTAGWWKSLLEALRNPECPMESREAIARTASQAFALASGTSSRICKSHAPATDATEQTSENIVEEKEEEVANRLIEWGLTDKMHEALRSQLPLLVEVLGLPSDHILDHQATTWEDEKKDDGVSENMKIRHPGKYETVPLGSWRLQLLSLLRGILTYEGKEKDDNQSSPRALAMDALMDLPLPAEVVKSKKGSTTDPSEDSATKSGLNPWPALSSFVWAYPNNDFYHIIFWEMLQAAVLDHHEPTLRLVLQKSKFLTRAINALSPLPNGTQVGLVLNCLNLLHLKSLTLPPSAFLTQYMGSHDGWKANKDKLEE